MDTVSARGVAAHPWDSRSQARSKYPGARYRPIADWGLIALVSPVSGRAGGLQVVPYHEGTRLWGSASKLTKRRPQGLQRYLWRPLRDLPAFTMPEALQVGQLMAMNSGD